MNADNLSDCIFLFPSVSLGGLQMRLCLVYLQEMIKNDKRDKRRNNAIKIGLEMAIFTESRCELASVLSQYIYLTKIPFSIPWISWTYNHNLYTKILGRDLLSRSYDLSYCC